LLSPPAEPSKLDEGQVIEIVQSSVCTETIVGLDCGMDYVVRGRCAEGWVSLKPDMLTKLEGHVEEDSTDALVRVLVLFLFNPENRRQTENGEYTVAEFCNDFWSNNAACAGYVRPNDKATDFPLKHGTWFHLTDLGHGQWSIGLTKCGIDVLNLESSVVAEKS
jgi:hypothetical protein